MRLLLATLLLISSSGGYEVCLAQSDFELVPNGIFANSHFVSLESIFVNANEDAALRKPRLHADETHPKSTSPIKPGE